MIFQQIKVGKMDNFAYIIADSESKETAIVDPGWDADILLGFCNKNNLKVKKILLTHTHYDHINDVEYIFGKTSAEVYVHALESGNIKNINNEIQVAEFENNNKINIGKIGIKVIHTPGHSPGSSCFLFENKIITGDTLFVGSIGRVDLPGGDEKQMFESLQQLKKLDNNLKVYPGHDYGENPFSTIFDEKKNNPYLK